MENLPSPGRINLNLPEAINGINGINAEKRRINRKALGFVG